MTEKELNEQYQYIQYLLGEKRLKEALDLLESTFWESNISEKLAAIRTPHDYMLKYMLEGMEDPQRNILYDKLIKDTIELTDLVFSEATDKVSYKVYHSLRSDKLPSLNGISYDSILNNLEAFKDELEINKVYNDNDKITACLEHHEKSVMNLFLKTWLSNNWSNGDKEEALAFLRSTLLLTSDLSLMVSAVTLSLITKFDERKFDWLMEAYRFEELVVSQRALVGVVIVTTMQHQRMEYYPEVVAKLSFMFDNEQTSTNIRNIYLQLLQSQETEKIDRKMREEIIPEMMKNASNIKGMKFGFEEGEESNELNPEWTDAMKSSGLDDKIKEMSELQMQGADVYMSSFSSLKGYPFFNEIQNWFYPFELKHSSVFKEFGNENKKGSVLDLILNSSLFCNSDKYSFCFTFQHIPKEQREMGLGQLSEEQMGGLEDEQKAMKLKELALNPKHISNQYIHDLYRFYKLYRFRKEFKDVFSMSLNLHQIPLFKQVLNNSEFLMALGEFFLKNEHFERAIEVYTMLEATGSPTAEVLQKKGFCNQKLKNYALAIEDFEKADVLKPDTLWTNRHLATCFRLMKNYEKALKYYLEVEKVQPENLSILFYIGMCYTALHQYNEALQYFYKMSFIKEGDKKATRAIGWTSFLTGNLEQAKKQYDTVLKTSNLAVDYLNAGHIAWALKDIRMAVAHYKRAIELYGDKTECIQLILKDKAQLLKQGIQENDLPLLIDLLNS